MDLKFQNSNEKVLENKITFLFPFFEKLIYHIFKNHKRFMSFTQFIMKIS